MSIKKLFSKLFFWLPGRKKPVVSVLRLSGVIGSGGMLRSGLSLEGIEDQISAAFDVPRAKSVAIAINSPGGSPVQSELIAKRIRDLAHENELPVVVFCEDVAASGGYWIACAADEIFAAEGSIIGSIGVVTAGFGFTEAIEKLGVERRLHTSGANKGMLDPFTPEKAEDVARLKSIQSDLHESFKNHVRKRRGDRLKGDEEELFSGAFWVGEKAKDLGLVDGIGDMRSVLRERFGEKVVLREIEGKKPFLRKLGIGSGRQALAELPGASLAAIEERAMWSRFGL